MLYHVDESAYADQPSVDKSPPLFLPWHIVTPVLPIAESRLNQYYLGKYMDMDRVAAIYLKL